MFGKFLIVALVCVSVAQVYGDELQIAIDRAVTRVAAMNENGRERYVEVVKDGDYNNRLIAYRSYLIVERARKVQESSRQAIRSVAALIEEKARENNRPQSVFQCIKTSEERGNSEIETFTTRFETDIDRLLNTKQDNLDVALRPCNDLQSDLQDNFFRTIDTIKNCPTVRCVNNAVGSFSAYLNTYYAAMRRIQAQVATVVANFQRDSNNYYTNSNRQVNRVRSTALRAVRACYYRGGRDVFEVQDSDEVQEF